MPLIHFATPPKREPAFHYGEGQESSRNLGPSRSPPPSTTSQRPARPEIEGLTAPFVLSHETAAAAQAPEPLTFEKRAVSRTPSSPEARQSGTSNSLSIAAGAQASLSLDAAHAGPAPGMPAREHKSLLTDALTSHKMQRPALPTSVSSGILRKGRPADAPTALAVVKESGTADQAVQHDAHAPITPLKAHFVEPEKPRRAHHASPPASPSIVRPPPPSVKASEQRPSPKENSRQTAVQLHRSEQPDQHSLTEERVASLGSEAPVLTRRRALVFQESSDVLERAAVRAARNAKGDATRSGNHSVAGSGGPAPSANEGGDATTAGEDTRRRGSQHSASSAGEESCSTRSSWVQRGSSPPTSFAASPPSSHRFHAKGSEKAEGIEDDEDEEDGSDDDVYGDDGEESSVDVDDGGEETPARTPSAETPTITSAVPKPSAATPRPNVPTTSLELPSGREIRLTFAQSPKELAAHRQARMIQGTSTGPHATGAGFVAGTSPAHARPRHQAAATLICDRAEASKHGEPQHARSNAAELGSAAAKRSLSFSVCPQPERENRKASARAKLSGSPAPNALSYKQRVRGMRGGGPILSPAPHAADRPLRPSSFASSAGSASSSGYSEDEEDESEDEEEVDSDDDDDDGDDDGSGAFDSSGIAHDYDDEQGEGDEDSEADEDGTQSDVDDDLNGPISSVTHLSLGTHASERNATQTAHLDAQAERPEASGEVARGRLPAGLPLHAAALPTAEGGHLSDGFGSRARKPRFDSLKRRALSQGDVAALNGRCRSAAVGPTVPLLPSCGQVGPSRRSISAQMSPSSRSALASKDSRNFSHPICFLPDTFEDSAPTSPVMSTHGDLTDGTGTAHYAISDLVSGPNSRRCSWQHVAMAASGDPSGGGAPISLPFHRGRDLAPASGPASDAETTGSRLAWRGPSWMQGRAKPTDINSVPATVSAEGQDPTGQSSLGLNFGVMTSRSLHVRSPSTKAVDDYQRAWSALNRRNSSGIATSFTAHAISPPRAAVAMSSASVLCAGTLSPRSPPARPASTQRAFSAATQVRCRPAAAECSRAAVTGATSPPKEDALSHLKHYFDHPPASFADVSRSSEVTTPASGTQSPVLGGGAGAAAARYWSETLSALAQAMGGDHGHPERGDYSNKDGYRSESNDFARHERSRSAPLDAMIESGVPAQRTWLPDAGRQDGQPLGEHTHGALGRGHVKECERAVSPIPRPIRIVSPPTAWTSDRDGEAPVRQANKARRLPKPSKKQPRLAKSQGASPPALHEYLRREEGPDGHTRLIVVTEDEGRRLLPRRKKKTSTTSMEFNWGRCRLTKDVGGAGGSAAGPSCQ